MSIEISRRLSFCVTPWPLTMVNLLESLPMRDPRPATEESPPAASKRKKQNNSVNHSSSKHITMNILRPHFEKPLAEVAALLGICTTLMKKVCRRVGIPRWPHRHIRSLRKSILSMEQASAMFEGEDRAVYVFQIRKQQRRLAMLLQNPNSLDIEDDDFDCPDENLISTPSLQHKSSNENAIQPISKNDLVRHEQLNLKPLDLTLQVRFTNQPHRQMRFPTRMFEYSANNNMSHHYKNYETTYECESAPICKQFRPSDHQGTKFTNFAFYFDMVLVVIYYHTYYNRSTLVHHFWTAKATDIPLYRFE
jgi:hypothetical protein